MSRRERRRSSVCAGIWAGREGMACAE